jgi:peptidoglycan/LPS O-acetylase OafA/YrhL
MQTRRMTIFILLAVAAVLIVWDVYVFVEPSEGDTISEVLARAPRFIVFAIGFVCGHIFWPQRRPPES